MLNLDLEIEKGSQSDNFGEGLAKSYTKLGEDTASDILGSTKSLTESTGIDYTNWSSDEAIAGNISAMVMLTGEEGLSYVGKNLEGYTAHLTELGMSAPEKLVDVVLKEVEVILAENGALSAIKTGLEATEKVVDAAKLGLDYATSYGTIAGNAAKLLTMLNKMQDPDTKSNPSVKDSTNLLAASAMTQLVVQYYALKAQLLVFYNSMICTSNDSTLDNMVVSVNAILNQIGPMIEPTLQKYTGYTVSEVRNLCNQGFAYVGMIQRASSQAKAKKDEAKEKVQSAKNDAEARVLSEKEKLKLSKEELKEYKKQQIEKSKQKFEKKKQDLSKGEAKAKLINWIKDQNIVLQNAFHLLIIMDTVKSIQSFLGQMQNMSIENQVDLLNALQDVLHIFEDLGLTPDAEGITLQDLKDLGIASVGMLAETGKNLGQQVENNANGYMNEQETDIKSKQYAKAYDSVNTLYGNGSEKVLDTVDSNGKSIKNILETEEERVSEDASILNDTVNSSILSNKGSISKTNFMNLNMCYFSMTNSGKNINVDIELTHDMGHEWMAMTAFIAQFKDSSGKTIFKEGAKKKIIEEFREAWETNSTVEFTINAIVNKVTKFYNFKIIINQEAYNDKGKTNKKIATKTLTGTSTTSNQNSSDGIVNTGAIQNAGNSTRKQAESKLTKDLQVNIDMSGIESILQGKVLMFDQVVQFLKILQPAIQLLYIVCHLLENWKINKEFVRTGQRAQLGEALRNAAKVVNGLKDMFTLGDTNFFTVRTKAMEQWIKGPNGFPTEKVNKDGFMVINQIQTGKLNAYCATHGINPDSPLILIKGTTIYFDRQGIDEGNQKDGTSNGLDVEVNRELGEVYFDSQHRPVISSQILQARKRNVSPNYIYNVQNEPKNDISELLKKVTFNSDEMEGTQTLNMCNVNLCPPLENRKEEKEAGENAVIVEFGVEYTLGNNVEYSLTVKPGQTLHEGDILGFIKKDGEQLPIKTQFSGTIRSIDENNSDFYHVYPTIATRHIIIDNPMLCKSDNYNINDVTSLQKKFKKATELEALIVNCMPLSILPILLTKANREDNTLTTGDYGTYTLFNTYMQDYDTAISDLGDRLKDACSSEGIMPQATSENSRTIDGKTYTKIDVGSTGRIIENMTGIKKSIIAKAISIYNSVNDLNSNDNIIGDYAYGDCIGLAYDKNNKFTRGKDKIEYDNYYISLLKAIPDSQKTAQPINVQLSDIQAQIDKMKLSDASINAGYHVDVNMEAISKQLDDFGKDDEDSYINKYRSLINEIIDNRLTVEQQNRENIVNNFNEFYFDKINQNIENPYESLKQRLNITEGDEVNPQDLLNQIKMDKLGRQYDLDDLMDSSLFRDADKTGQKDDKKYFDCCKQAQTMFTYLISSNISISSRPLPRKLTTSKLVNDDINYIKNTIDELGKDYIHQDIVYKEQNYVSLYDLAINVVSQAYDASILEMKHQKQVNELKKIIPELPNDVVDYIINAVNATVDKETLNAQTILFFDRAGNNMFYELVKSENEKIKSFWDEILAEYGKNNSDGAIQALKDYANKMNSDITWPQPVKINIEQTNYDLYTFMDPFKTEMPEVKDVEFTNMAPEPQNPEETEIDLNNLPDKLEPSPITIFDYTYWLVYMLNATLFTLLPQYWADGFDIPPFMTPLPLPAIYMPVAPPVFIPKINVLMVFGIALRGMWPAPIILLVNLSSNDIDAMIVVKLLLEIAKDIFEKIMDTIENGIPRMVNEIINSYINENDVAKKAIEKFRTYSSIIKAIPVKDKALFEQKMNDALQDSMNENADLVNANKKLDETRTKLRMYDRRQVLTRESDLGNGPEPM